METPQSWTAEPLSSLGRVLAQISNSSVGSNRSQGEMYAVVVFFSTLVLAYVIWRVSLGKKSTPPLPPGSFGLPIIGDTLRYFSAYQKMKTKEWVEEKRKKYGPLFKTSILSQGTVFLDEPGGCKLLLSQPDEKLLAVFFPKSIRVVGGPNNPLLASGQVHVTYRKYLISYFLGADAVGRYLPIMEEQAISHIQRHWMSKDDGTTILALEALELFNFSITTELLLSLTDVKTVEELRSLFTVFSRGMISTPINLPGFQYHRSLKSRDQIHQMIQPIIEKRKVELKEGTATPTQDYLSILLTQPDEQGHFHTEEQICVILTTTLWAGADTTAATMTMVLRAVSKHPEVYEQLIKEHRQIAANKAEGEPLTRQEVRSMKYTWAVIQETLRVTPAAVDISRQAKADIHYKGYVIPKGYKLVCSAAQSMWNPDVYPDPERFDPSRFIRTGATKNIEPFTFLGFGGSSRVCPGQEFARLGMLAFFHHFFKNIQFTLEEPDEKLLYHFVVCPEKGLPVRIQKSKLY